MEKSAVKTYKDPAMNKIVQEKAELNKGISLLINNIINFKKSFNGHPSKYYKEKIKLSQPSPIDLASILNSLTHDFQELANQGNSIIQEQKEFANNHVKRHSENVLNRLEQKHGPTEGLPPAGPDLSQQMGQKMSSFSNSQLIKLADDMELKYELEVQASNPFSRFITRLFNPKFGFGEGARFRRLRMAMLDNCVKSYKEIKKLHKEIVKSSSNSIVNSHKMMTQIFNYWNAVNRLFSTYKAIRPDDLIKDEGGKIENDPEIKRQNALEEGRDPEENTPSVATPAVSDVASKIKDYKAAANHLGSATSNPAFRELNSLIETVLAAPKGKRFEVLQKSNINAIYDKVLQEVNAELNTNGQTFMQIVEQLKNKPSTKEAQKQLGKIRHQLIPGATSGQRLEIYQFISQIRKDMNEVMNILEKGFDQEQLTTAIGQVTREMSALRTMMRSLYYSEKPAEVSSPFF